MDALKILLETDALKRLKARYFRFYDTKDWDSWLDLFTEDAVLEASPTTIWHEGPPEPPLRLVGRAEIGRYVRSRGPLRHTVHHGHTPEIDLLDENTATGIWAMEDIVEHADNRMHGHGHYHETYRRIDGRWQFTSVRLTRLRVVHTPLPGGPII